MAAGYFRKLLRDKKIENVDVRSAGVITVSGLRASQEAVQIMEHEGVDLSTHRSSQLTPEVARKADLILGMTPMHVQEALRISRDVRGKAFLLKEYVQSDLKNTQINDPMGSTLEVFKKIFREIRQACERLMISEIVTGVPVTFKDRPARTRKAAKRARPAVREAKPASKRAESSTEKKAAAKPSKRKSGGTKAATRTKKASAKISASSKARAAINQRRRVKPSVKLAARKTSKTAQGKLR